MPAGADSLMVENLAVDYSGRRVVDGVSLTVEPGKIAALFGPNGAGKSELVLSIAGMLPKLSGRVTVGGKDITSLRPEGIRASGVSAVPEGHHVLTKLSVEDNLRAAGAMLSGHDLSRGVEAAYEIFSELRPLKNQSAGSLSGGQQQMVALAQALVCRPQYLLVDEMSLSLAPVIVKRLMTVISRLKEEGIGILLIEQFTHLALGVADNAYVLNRGTVQFAGSPQELRSDSRILHEAYLGV